MDPLRFPFNNSLRVEAAPCALARHTISTPTQRFDGFPPLPHSRTTEAPGLSTLRLFKHDRNKKREAAVLKIQAVYRGHRVRISSLRDGTTPQIHALPIAHRKEIEENQPHTGGRVQGTVTTDDLPTAGPLNVHQVLSPPVPNGSMNFSDSYRLQRWQASVRRELERREEKARALWDEDQRAHLREVTTKQDWHQRIMLKARGRSDGRYVSHKNVLYSPPLYDSTEESNARQQLSAISHGTEGVPVVKSRAHSPVTASFVSALATRVQTSPFATRVRMVPPHSPLTSTPLTALPSDLDSDIGPSAEISTGLKRLCRNDLFLTTLDLRRRRLTDEDVIPVFAALQINTVLTTLYLDHNQLSDGTAESLAKTLLRNQTLTSIGLSRNTITDRGALVLYEALKKNNSLQSLDLGDNLVTEYVAQSIAKMVKYVELSNTKSVT